MNIARIRATAFAVALLFLLAGVPASGHTTDWWTCNDPSPQTGEVPADIDCTAHLHWSDKSDWLSIAYPDGTVFNHDEDSAYPDGAADPADGDRVGETVIATNFSVDFDCSTSDDLRDGGTYDISWEDSWSSYTPPSGWAKVAEYKTVVLLVNVPTHVIYNPTTGAYRTETDLPTTLTCSGTPTNMTIQLYSHANNDPNGPWVIKNPPAGTHTVTATVSLTTSTQHSDTASITTI